MPNGANRKPSQLGRSASLKRFTVIAVIGISRALCQIVSGQDGAAGSWARKKSGLSNSPPSKLPAAIMAKPSHHCLRLMRPLKLVSNERRLPILAPTHRHPLALSRDNASSPADKDAA